MTAHSGARSRCPWKMYFGLDRVKTLAPKHPEWKEKEPFASVLKNDMKGVMAGGEHGLVEIIEVTHSGMTVDEFETIGKDWIATAKHPKFGQLYTKMIYQPMLELLGYLRANGFKTFIVSGGGIEFMRTCAEKTYGIPPEQVVGSSGKTEFEMRDGKPVLAKLPEINFDRRQGPANPLASTSTSAADPSPPSAIRMAIWKCCNTPAAGSGSRFCLYVHHDDAVREYAYDRKDALARFDKGWDEAIAKGWPVVSMKNDWKTIFAFETK